jgi:hypothetical protein
MKQHSITFVFFTMLCTLLSGFGQVKGQQAGYNLVNNGRFDLSGLSWGTYYRYATPGIIKQDGCCNMLLEFIPGLTTQTMAQEIDYPVKKGDTLIFEFFYRHVGSSTSPAPNAYVSGYPPGNNYASSFVSDGQGSVSLVPSLYTKMQQVLIVNNDYTKLKIQFTSFFRTTTSAPGTYVQIDDVSLVYKPKVPDATTGGGVTGGSSQWTTASPTRINYNNQVAIGGDKFYNDPNYKLSVNGRLAAEEVLVLMRADWPDYVFGSKYPLMPLGQLENFIQRNKHLPGIPSAAEVQQKGGVEIGEMQRKMMEKIEELTLYILQQQKKMEAQQKRIESLEKKASAQ